MKKIISLFTILIFILSSLLPAFAQEFYSDTEGEFINGYFCTFYEYDEKQGKYIGDAVIHDARTPGKTLKIPKTIKTEKGTYLVTKFLSTRKVYNPGIKYSEDSYGFNHISTKFMTENYNKIVLPDSVEFLNLEAFGKSSKKRVTVVLGSGVKTIRKPCSKGNPYKYIKFDISKSKNHKIRNNILTYKKRTVAPLGNYSSYVIPSYVTHIGGFKRCNNLKKIVIPSNVVKIYDEAFMNCSNVKTLTFQKRSKLIYIGEKAFSGLGKVTKLTVPARIDENGYGFSDMKGLKNVKFASGYKNKKLNDFMFSFSKIEKFEIPRTVEVIGRGAFSYCTKLDSIELSEKIKEIGAEAFKYCGIKSISIPKGITEIKEDTFHDSELRSIELGANIKKIGDSAFRFSKIKSIKLPEGLEEIGRSAFAATPLKKISFPSTLKIIGSYAFSTTKLEKITIPETVEEIGAHVFGQCVMLKKATIGQGIETIQRGTFAYCSALESVSIKGSNIKKIDLSSFYKCPRLKSIEILEAEEAPSITYDFSEGVPQTVIICVGKENVAKSLLEAAESFKKLYRKNLQIYLRADLLKL